MYKLAVVAGGNAFLPEAVAYKRYFLDKGVDVRIVKSSDDLRPFDACILFHGFHPFWKAYPKVVVGEYHSLSTGKYGRTKDFLKRIFNVRSDMYIFLNNYVRRRLHFSGNVQYVMRPMGYFDEYVKEFQGSEKFYDIVYSGSLRPGVKDVVKKLADLGLKIALVGGSIGYQHPNICSFGKVSHRESYRIMSLSRVGLNYCPDSEPWSEQDSTKTIEYCASGLGVITNRYSWIDSFEDERNGRFLDVDDIASIDQFLSFEYVIPDVSDLSWSSILEDSKLYEKIWSNLQ